MTTLSENKTDTHTSMDSLFDRQHRPGFHLRTSSDGHTNQKNCNATESYIEIYRLKSGLAHTTHRGKRCTEKIEYRVMDDKSKKNGPRYVCEQHVHRIAHHLFTRLLIL